MAQYKFVGVRHPDELADGRVLTLGDTVTLTDQQIAANQRLIDEGLLIEKKPKSEKTRTAARQEKTK